MPRNTKKSYTNRSKKLSTQLSIMISAMLILVFTVFILAAVLMSKSALSEAISSNFSNNSEKNAAKVQGTFDEAASLGKNLQYYMNRMYQLYDMQIKFGTVDDTTYRSDVCGQYILAINKDIEDYVANTIKSAVTNNPDIMAAGLFFDQYAFDPSVKEYAIYIQESDIEKFVSIPYSEYSTADYYKVALETQKPYFTEPYDYNGTKMVSGCYPIISNGKSQGVVSVDINVSNFNKYAVSTDTYPTLFNEILTDRSTVVFDSTGLSGEYVGMNTSDFIKNASDVKKIMDGYAAKTPFTLVTTGNNGQKVNRFYYPVTAGEQTWWSLTSLDSKDMNKATSSLITILIVIAAASLIIIVIITIMILRRKISPINQVVMAAENIVQGDLDIDINVQSNDEIGQLAHSFSQMSSSLREIILDIGYLLNEMSQGNFLVKTGCEEKYIGNYQNILTAVRNINTKLSDTLGQINRASDQVFAGSEQVSAASSWWLSIIKSA